MGRGSSKRRNPKHSKQSNREEEALKMAQKANLSKEFLIEGKRIVKHSEEINKEDIDWDMGVHFQEEIIMDILTRLPVRSLLRFKCVSKFWKTLISEPHFAMKHLNLAKNNQDFQKILIRNGMFSLHPSSLTLAPLSSVQLTEDVEKLECIYSGRPWSCKIYCCYNGLALMEVRKSLHINHLMLLLWNPSTRKSIVLPPTEISPARDYTWGFGYDSTSDDYKILKLDNQSRSEILALKSGSWRKVDEHPAVIYTMWMSDMHSLAFVHGAFHWLGFSLNECVVSFNISNEVYAEIPLLDGMFVPSYVDYFKHGVSALGGMLCVYSTHAHRGKYTSNFWVLKDYGVEKSWNQLFSIQRTDLSSIIPEYRFSDGEVLLRCRHKGRNGYVFKMSKESSGLWPQSDSEHIENGFVYTESLISPKLLA